MSETYTSLWPRHEVAKREFMADILAEVADKHGLRVHDLVCERRTKPIVLARQEAMWEVRNRTPMSLPEIGRRLGGRDHTTVLHGIRQHSRRLAEAREA